MHGRERVRELPIAGVALVLEPFLLGAPVHVVIRLPDVAAAPAKAEGLERHRRERHVPGQDHQVSPRDLLAVLLFDGPAQVARFVQTYVVRPAIERSEALLTATAATANVPVAVGTGAVPGHANEWATVVAEVRRPPVLRVGHHVRDVFFQGGKVEALEGFPVFELRAHGLDLAEC